MTSNINEALMRRARATPTPSPAKRKRATTGATSGPIPSPFKTCKTSFFTAVSPALKTRRKVANPITATDAATISTGSSNATAIQSYLDLGQESFGQLMTCKTCGLVYTAGEQVRASDILLLQSRWSLQTRMRCSQEDEKEHAAFCKRFQKGIVVSRWKNERLINEFPASKSKYTMLTHDCIQMLTDSLVVLSLTGRIIEIRREDPKTHVSKLLEIKTLLDDALGFVEPDVFWQRSHFVYVTDRQVVGCVAVEPIKRAFPIDLTASTIEVPSVDEAAFRPAVVGVCQIWVHPRFRRRQVASRLVDAVRDKFIYGLRIAKDAVAFAQPTRDGLVFAKQYVSPGDVLTYDAAF